MGDEKVTHEELYQQLLKVCQAGHQLIDALLVTGGTKGEDDKLAFPPYMTVLQYEAHRRLEETAYRVSDLYNEIRARTEEGLAEVVETAAAKGNAPFNVVEGGKNDAQ